MESLPPFGANVEASWPDKAQSDDQHSQGEWRPDIDQTTDQAPLLDDWFNVPDIRPNACDY